MTSSLADVDRDTAALRAFEGVDVTGLTRAELLDALRLVTAGKHSYEVLAAELAGEVSRRSTLDDGPGGMARQQGFASAEQLVASVVGGEFREGKKLVSAGELMSAARPAGEGVRDGSVSVAKAELIASTLAPLVGDTRALEAKLTRLARTLDYARLKTACRIEAARFDARQLEDRKRRQREARYLDFTEDANGMTHVRGALDPTSAAVIKTYVDAQVKAAFQAKREASDDHRTAGQIRLDSLVALATHGLDCTARATGVKATVIVRINEDQLEDELGVATCDALATPISLATLRQLAVDAGVLPIVMNGKSECLDMGREQRLFSWAQRMALAERDGGCARCHAPISHCIAHHIRWWSRDGRTDLRNGVLLCVRCHTQLHYDGWEIEVDADNQVWFIAPAHLDAGRQRTLGGLAALSVRGPRGTPV